MWKYVPLLHEIQEDASLRLANKISKKVIDWRSNKMNVNIAAITLSNKTADSIFFLDKVENIKQFKGSLHTIIFMKACNLTFDILDSRNGWAIGCKKAISEDNVKEIFEWMNSLEKYFKSLMLDNGTYVLFSANFTAFASALMGFFNVRQLYHILVESNILPRLKMHDASQDELEHLFGDFRCRCFGNNNNPSAFELSMSYRNLQALNEIIFTRKGGNCPIEKGENSMKMLKLDQSVVVKNTPFNVDESLKRQVKTKNSLKRLQRKRKTFDDETVTNLKENAIAYIAGYTQRILIENLECEDCKNSIQSEEDTIANRFIDAKKWGNLVYPNKYIVEICRKANFIYEIEALKISPLLPQIVALKVLRDLDLSIFHDLADHPSELNTIEDHRYTVIKKTIKIFVNSKSRLFCNSFNLNLHEKRVRHDLSNVIKCKGQ